MPSLEHHAAAKEIEAYVNKLLKLYKRDGSVAFSRLTSLIETLWRQHIPSGLSAFFRECERFTAHLPDEMVFEGNFRQRNEKTDMAELRLFARSGEVLQPHDGARLFRNGTKGLAIMLTRSNGAKRSTQWGEFFLWRALRELGMSLLLMGDRQNLIFQQGFGEFYGRLGDGLKWIDMQLSPYDCAFFVGNSASGFPALQFAANTKACNALTYSAGTHFPNEEYRVVELKQRLQSRIVDRPLDVRPMLHNFRGAMHLHYPAQHPVDILHAGHLADLPTARLIPHDTDFHPLFGITSSETFIEHIQALYRDPNFHRMR
ncbi:MAG: hypothetical protein LAT77_10535 [Aliidiomarina sp.]|uniref:hypothetical protein n=1 Tax=Aliidiomarina sp. TaxID=1872439 RepID=UPI0025BA5F41|nr:hypothetical protein [Aliidiomarina sp.]MCH8502331.1 hypothetical protein [Aliidiomarina sp.]